MIVKLGQFIYNGEFDLDLKIRLKNVKVLSKSKKINLRQKETK